MELLGKLLDRLRHKLVSLVLVVLLLPRFRLPHLGQLVPKLEVSVKALQV